MSEQSSELAGAPHATGDASVPNLSEQTTIAPDHEAPMADEPKAAAAAPEPVKSDAAKEPPRIGSTLLEPSSSSNAKSEPKPGKLIVMAPSDRGWDHEPPHVKPAATEPGVKGRSTAIAAAVALAAVVGAISGVVATAAVLHMGGNQAPAQVANTGALEASVARIDADIVALKASLDHTSKADLSRFNKTSDRLDKLEKAQAEPQAKLAKLTETVEKLRTAQVAPPPVQAAAVAPKEQVKEPIKEAAKESTGSVAPTQLAAAAPAPPAQAASPAAPASGTPKVDVGRLPTVEGWRLRDVANGGALIESRSGVYEVYAGDPVPGLGRIDAIRRQDGRWVVITTRGLIVAR